ncbi:hypothetical protein U1Q18_036143 [Sarracenia purpurea var. burkii]
MTGPQVTGSSRARLNNAPRSTSPVSRPLCRSNKPGWGDRALGRPDKPDLEGRTTGRLEEADRRSSSVAPSRAATQSGRAELFAKRSTSPVRVRKEKQKCLGKPGKLGRGLQWKSTEQRRLETSAVDPSPSHTAELKPTTCSDLSSPSTTPLFAIHLAFAASAPWSGVRWPHASFIADVRESRPLRLPPNFFTGETQDRKKKMGAKAISETDYNK